MTKRTIGTIIISLLILLCVVCILSLCLGALSIRPQQIGSMIGVSLGFSDQPSFSAIQQSVLTNIRLPRIVLGVLVGATLSVCGAATQGVFRNPLADPSLIGISAGAMLSASLVIVLGVPILDMLSMKLGFYSIYFAAFIGACAVAFLVYRLSVQNGRADITILLLAGIAINALAGSATGILTYLSDDDELRNITFWSLGSLGGASWKTVLGVTPFLLVPIICLPFLSKALNALAFGESQALYMGVDIGVLKKTVIFLTTLGVGASVAVSGMIGFVGIVVPHIVRMAFSSDNRVVLPASAILGAVLLVAADLIARTIVAPAEIPIGILTSLIGTPIFIYIIVKERQSKAL